MTPRVSNDTGVSKEMQILCDNVLADPVWAFHLGQMWEVLNDFDAGIAEELDLSAATSRRCQSIVRYCVPLIEMHSAIDGRTPEPAWLAAMYLWQEVWRPLDNLIDGEGPVLVNLQEYNIALLRAWTFQSNVLPGTASMATVLDCLNDTIGVEQSAERRSNQSLIYMRVRLYEVIFEGLPGLSEETRRHYRDYINSIGIAHDFGDVVGDIRAGSVTFATAILETIDPHSRLTHRNYNTLREECLARFQKQLAHLDDPRLSTCWVTRGNVGAFSTWAFDS